MADDKPSLNDLRIERRQRRESRLTGRALLLLVLLCLGGGLTAWWLGRPSAVELKTVVARETSADASDQTVLNASGYVTARREATVSSKVTGKVVEVLVEEGMRVEADQVLARLDDTNVKASLLLTQAQLKSAQTALEETRVRIKEAELNLRRTADLARNSISAQADLDHAVAEADSLKARLQQQEAEVTVAERQLASWQQQLDDTIIRAPFGGIVTSKNAQPGEMISPISAGGGFTRTGICTIVDMESLEVEIDVNESYINRVQPGQEVEATLDAYPDWKIPCKVIAIIPTADRQKSTVKVRVGFDRLDARILPEMSVKVAFRQGHGGAAATSRRGVTVPKAAVRQMQGKMFVVVIRDGRAERRAVSASDLESAEVVVSTGLAAGEKVALDWPAELRDGASVREKTR